MSRFGWIAACALAGAVLSSSCERPTGPGTQQLAELRVTALLAGTPIDLLVVRVTASDIPTPLVFNLAVQNGVAQGTIRLPPGMKRMITVDAYDSDGDVTAEGSKTIDVRPGQNPPVSIPLVSKAGQVTITVTIGPVSVVLQPTSPTVQVGATLQLSVTITATNGDVLAGPAEWATTNPAVVTVDGNGKVTGVMPGTVDIVATFAGVAGVSHVTVASQIAFSSNGDIALMNADGSGQTLLTTTGRDFFPAWSPDGTRIAFESSRDGANQIYVMNADGTGVIRLTNAAANEEVPTWAPDGTKIAFFSNRDGPFAIYVIDAAGMGSAVRLTTDAADNFDPAWSPDGTKIAFASARNGNYQIYVMNADGTGVTRLTSNAASERFPSWSPDGARIAFQSDRDSPFATEIYAMMSNGGSQTRITNNPAIDERPVWSPDGSKIAFDSNRDDPAHLNIYVMNADGTGVVRLTANPMTSDNGPSWRP